MVTEYSKYEPIFGSWHIVRLLGEGSYGKVYEIQREDFGVTYKAALKAITIPKSRSEVDSVLADGMDEKSASDYFKSFAQEFTREFALMDKVKGYSNIVSYEDHVVIEHQGDIGWDILIRMELLTPLTAYQRSHELSVADVVRMGIDICKALELCGRYNIIHRDIKPENIFLSDAGIFKLGDFGIARVAEKTTGASTKVGTQSYIAPEVLRGEKYSSSVDIYSLGIMLYKFLNNNRLPFLPAAPAPISYSDREQANARRFGGEALPMPANADADLARIVLKAAAFNPADRYTNATVLRADLERYLQTHGNIGTATVQPAVNQQPVRPQQAAESTVGLVPGFEERKKPAPAYEATEIITPGAQDVRGNYPMEPQAVVPQMPADQMYNAAPVAKPRKRKGLIFGIIAAALALAVGVTAFLTIGHNNSAGSYKSQESAQENTIEGTAATGDAMETKAEETETEKTEAADDGSVKISESQGATDDKSVSDKEVKDTATKPEVVKKNGSEFVNDRLYYNYDMGISISLPSDWEFVDNTRAEIAAWNFYDDKEDVRYTSSIAICEEAYAQSEESCFGDYDLSFFDRYQGYDIIAEGNDTFTIFGTRKNGSYRILKDEKSTRCLIFIPVELEGSVYAVEFDYFRDYDGYSEAVDFLESSLGIIY